MSLKDRLADFAGALTSATMAPDEYAVPEYQNYESNKADLTDLWSQIRPQIKRDVQQANLIDDQLQEMFSFFDRGEKNKGRKLAWAIYNSDVEKLR
ncbi:hypothetical protein SAMN05443579_112312 [Variovorax sp. PDC80]|uniref:hypothetical protein n=1 Tax=Variovorax sp. PDC80 TaxID=1882827 RepID=UPI0008E1877D|nr:hypothetical protein [Variovorax sp. PDC80]SFP58668.1 hypothetical protein SAMN05443579_112312 [Variovorax sp. PDC80]